MGVLTQRAVRHLHGCRATQHLNPCCGAQRPPSVAYPPCPCVSTCALKGGECPAWLPPHHFAHQPWCKVAGVFHVLREGAHPGATPSPYRPTLSPQCLHQPSPHRQPICSACPRNETLAGALAAVLVKRHQDTATGEREPPLAKLGGQCISGWREGLDL